MNNLNELNNVLFDTLRSVKDGKMDDAKAKTITVVSNSIINNAKLQLNAARYLKSSTITTNFFGELKAKENIKLSESNDLYNKKLEYSLSMGYSNLSEALNNEGKAVFEKGFKEFLK